MNGVHDLGGMHGLGPIAPEANEPVFHEEWERRMFALFVASFAGGHYNVDEFRFAIERMGPAEYLQSSYYEHWLHAVDLAGRTRRADGCRNHGADDRIEGGRLMPALAVEQVDGLVATGASTRMDVEAKLRFKVGDRVTALNINPTTHTRLPRYVRGKTGTVVLAHGVFSFNDTNAHNLGHKPQHVYTVSFSATELWGPHASSRDTLRIDLFDDYLEPAPSAI